MSTKHLRALSGFLFYASLISGSFICCLVVLYVDNFLIIDIVMIVFLLPVVVVSFTFRESMYFLYNNRIKRELFQVLALVAEANGVSKGEVMKGIRKTLGHDSNMEGSFKRSYSYMDFSMDFSKFARRQTLIPNYEIAERYSFRIGRITGFSRYFITVFCVHTYVYIFTGTNQKRIYLNVIYSQRLYTVYFGKFIVNIGIFISFYEFLTYPIIKLYRCIICIY